MQQSYRAHTARFFRFGVLLGLISLGACDWGLQIEKKVQLTQKDYSELPGWEKDDARHALVSFSKSCEQITKTSICEKQESAIYLECDEMREICGRLPKNKQTISTQQAKSFFEENFTPYLVSDTKQGEIGLFTGYYLPLTKGSTTKTTEFSAPIYSRPLDLVNNEKYKTRSEIENAGLSGKSNILYWIHPVDLLDMQIQGSVVLELENKKQVLLGYDGNNGYDFQSVSIAMKQQKIQPTNGFTAQGVKEALKKLSTEKQREIIQTNPRYIFFKENTKGGAIGSLGAVLTPQRSLAVDPKYIPLGVPIFLNTSAKGYNFEKLVMAQDTGSKITGAVRGDLFWGLGEQALEWAGKMKNDGTYYVLLPKNKPASYR